MDDVTLSERQFLVLRSLMGAEPVPGQPLPGVDVLDRLNALVPCDWLTLTYTDLTGLTTASASIQPSGRGHCAVSVDLNLHQQHDGPFYLGVMHWRMSPAHAEACEIPMGPRDDGLAIGFRNGTDHVVQYGFIRDGGYFTAHELAILDLISPVLQRLARERPTPALPATVTVSERRILCALAAGLSTKEIAEGHCITVSTVRKHLENAYRKLGVTNRLAAIARLSGSDEPGLDLHERGERTARRGSSMDWPDTLSGQS
jgi:DNA-binding CsgD family transcriptional regulator